MFLKCEFTILNVTELIVVSHKWEPQSQLCKRDFSSFNQQVLLDDMQSVDWHIVFDSIENPSDLFKSFYIKLSGVIDVHISLK